MIIPRTRNGPLARAGSFSLSILLSLATGAWAGPATIKSSPPLLKRYVVLSDDAATAAVKNGAEVVCNTKGLKAVMCPASVAAALNLTEDIPLHAMDSTANTRVLATRAQEMGLTGRGRKIVILDTGYNYLHRELSSSYLGGRDFVNHDDDPFDDNGHGSHVAGIITGDGIDPAAKGIAPETGIIAGKVLDAFGNGFTSDLVAAIYWAVDGPDGIYGDGDDFQPDAINISIGTSGTDLYPAGFCDSAFPPLTYAIKYAVDHGIMVVVAAGNNGSAGVAFPGCVSYATTVGAITGSNTLASFSGMGPEVGLVAPGVGLYSSYLGQTYKTRDGTSQATPVVSGIIALLKEAFPNASVDSLRNALLTTATDLGATGTDNRYGYGEVNACLALGALTTNLVNVALNLSRSNNQVIISWPATLSGFVLQARTSPDPTASGWRTVTNPVVVFQNQNTTTISSPAPNQFYRLNWQ